MGFAQKTKLEGHGLQLFVFFPRETEGYEAPSSPVNAHIPKAPAAASNLTLLAGRRTYDPMICRALIRMILSYSFTCPSTPAKTGALGLGRGGFYV